MAESEMIIIFDEKIGSNLSYNVESDKTMDSYFNGKSMSCFKLIFFVTGILDQKLKCLSLATYYMQV
jgi:hypothetical protein